MRNSIEKIPLSDWPMRKSVGIFLVDKPLGSALRHTCSSPRSPTLCLWVWSLTPTSRENSENRHADIWKAPNSLPSTQQSHWNYFLDSFLHILPFASLYFKLPNVHMEKVMYLSICSFWKATSQKWRVGLLYFCFPWTGPTPLSIAVSFGLEFFLVR